MLTTPPGAPDFTLSVYFESKSSENISGVKCDGVSLGCLLNLVDFPEYKRWTECWGEIDTTVCSLVEIFEERK